MLLSVIIVRIRILCAIFAVLLVVRTRCILRILRILIAVRTRCVLRILGILGIVLCAVVEFVVLLIFVIVVCTRHVTYLQICVGFIPVFLNTFLCFYSILCTSTCYAFIICTFSTFYTVQIIYIFGFFWKALTKLIIQFC